MGQSWEKRETMGAASRVQGHILTARGSEMVCPEQAAVDKPALGAPSCWLSGDYLPTCAAGTQVHRNWWDTESQSAGKLRCGLEDGR